MFCMLLLYATRRSWETSMNACGVFGCVLSFTQAPVAQRIEHWPPESGAGVRVAPGAPFGEAVVDN